MAAALRTLASPVRDRAQARPTGGAGPGLRPSPQRRDARPDGMAASIRPFGLAPRQIFLIARYRRVSGSALTAITPSTIPATARVIAVTYPSARIIFLLPSGGSATAARDIDIPHPGAGSAPVLMPVPASAGLPSACSSATCLIAVLDGGRPARFVSLRSTAQEGPPCHAEGGVIERQQCLPVQRNGVTLVTVPAAGRGGSTNPAGLTRSQHQKLRAPRRHAVNKRH